KCGKSFAVSASAEPAAVPAAAGHAPADAESLALSVLAEESVAKKEEAKPEAEPIVVKCEHCDFVNRFEARMAGRNAPCAECRRILKVPLPVKAEAKDWRTVQAKPTLARQDTEQLEGAWGVGQAQAVSVEALKGADVGG